MNKEKIVYKKVSELRLNKKNPKVAVEVLIGHGTSTVIVESSVDFELKEIGDSDAIDLSIIY